MSIATMPKGAGFLQKFATYQSKRMSAQRAERRLKTALRTRGISQTEIIRLQEESESLWIQTDLAGSEFAKAKHAAVLA